MSKWIAASLAAVAVAMVAAVTFVPSALSAGRRTTVGAPCLAWGPGAGLGDCNFFNGMGRALLDATPPADLIVTTDARPFVANVATWHITKDSDQSQINVAPGGTATFNYTLNVTHDIGPDSDWQVFGAIHIFNPNAFDVAGVDVTEAVADGGTCTVNDEPIHTVTVPAGGALNLRYSCLYSAAPSPSTGTAVATASWADFGSPHTSASAPAAFDFTGVVPAISPASVDVRDPLDPDGDLIGSVTVDDPSPVAFTYSVPYSGDPAGTCTSHVNTARITDDQQVLDSATKTVEVCVGGDLNVTTTANASFKRTYAWKIAKSVDNTQAKCAPGCSATFNYTVNAGETGFADSAWQLQGAITVANPNDWEPVTFDLADAVDNGGVCTIAGGGAGLTLAAGATGTYGYTCAYTSAPSPAAFTNKATATWDNAAAFTADASASGAAPAAFAAPTTTVNKTVTVNDTFNQVTTTLGTLTATDSQPFASATYPYPRTVFAPASGCVSYPNTATLVETGQSATASVTVCAAAQTCPGEKINFRWHYSANGTSGSWSGTKSTTCDGSTLTMGPQAMEGDLKLAPGTTLHAGYDFTIPGNATARTITVNNPQVVFALRCVSGATPSQSTLTVPMSTVTSTVSDSGWYPSGDQHSPVVYQGSVAVPNVCGGSLVRLDKGGTFTAIVTIEPVGVEA